jgi:carbonic anhydrase
VATAAARMPGAAKDAPDYLQRVVEENVRITVADIQKNSPVLSELVAQGQLKVVGAWYDLATGKVHWLE